MTLPLKKIAITTFAHIFANVNETVNRLFTNANINVYRESE